MGSLLSLRSHAIPTDAEAAVVKSAAAMCDSEYASDSESASNLSCRATSDCPPPSALPSDDSPPFPSSFEIKHRRDIHIENEEKVQHLALTKTPQGRRMSVFWQLHGLQGRYVQIGSNVTKIIDAGRSLHAYGTVREVLGYDYNSVYFLIDVRAYGTPGCFSPIRYTRHVLIAPRSGVSPLVTFPPGSYSDNALVQMKLVLSDPYYYHYSHEKLDMECEVVRRVFAYLQYFDIMDTFSIQSDYAKVWVDDAGEETYPTDVRLGAEELEAPRQHTDMYTVTIVEHWGEWLDSVNRARNGITDYELYAPLSVESCLQQWADNGLDQHNTEVGVMSSITVYDSYLPSPPPTGENVSLGSMREEDIAV